jgi:hypothetical protein
MYVYIAFNYTYAYNTEYMDSEEEGNTISGIYFCHLLVAVYIKGVTYVYNNIAL